MTSFYFAYGSNMSLAQMRERCPSSVRIGIGRLDGHRLVFPRLSTKRQCGAASVESCPDQHVWGVIYEMDPADFVSLDGHEGYDPRRTPERNNYNRKRLLVLRDGLEPLDCLTYIATAQSGAFLPSAHYHGLIHSGAVENGLPMEYVEKLAQIKLLTD